MLWTSKIPKVANPVPRIQLILKMSNPVIRDLKGWFSLAFSTGDSQ